MASGKSLKDSITNIRGWHQRITLALDYGGQDVGYLFQRMKWAVEDMEQRFDKYFPPPNIDTEEGRKAEDQLNEFLETWGLSIEDMDTEEFLTSLMHLFNRDIEPKYQLKDLDSQHISPCGVWMMMEALAPIVDKGVSLTQLSRDSALN
ncbi:hypothetical protein QBC40DRAFT_274703 [Triangularia verruculosa]|uniref:Uncharacterized protein n=1 Tax=Triangularia verruculosa TaxID=2587418 RepID=A0AAN6XN49_9PEZI|nr:hypothetical protein QBC40DRAFT_274703 [Triangularia verruculosa]